MLKVDDSSTVCDVLYVCEMLRYAATVETEFNAGDEDLNALLLWFNCSTWCIRDRACGRLMP